jgi:hypothetical protein
MSNQCITCLHARRLDIDRQIVGGGSLARIAETFGVEYHSLRHHAKHHISRQLATVMAKKEITVGEELLETINKIITRAELIFTRNYKDKKDFLALKALDSQRNTIQLLSNISSQLHAAKMAELELERKTSGADEITKKLQYRKMLQVLSDRELKLYQRLTAKINNQNNDPIRPDHYNNGWEPES